MNPRFHIREHTFEGIDGAPASGQRQILPSARQQFIELTKQLIRLAPASTLPPVLRLGSKTNPLTSESEGVVQVAGQLVARPPFKRLLEGGNLVVVVKRFDDLARIQRLDESARLAQTVDMIASDDVVKSMPLRSGTVEELECEVGGSIQKSDMGNTIEELPRLASELVQPSSPSGLDRFNAQIFGANPCALIDAELTYSLHESPTG